MEALSTCSLILPQVCLRSFKKQRVSPNVRKQLTFVLSSHKSKVTNPGQIQSVGKQTATLRNAVVLWGYECRKGQDKQPFLHDQIPTETPTEEERHHEHGN